MANYARAIVDKHVAYTFARGVLFQGPETSAGSQRGPLETALAAILDGTAFSRVLLQAGTNASVLGDAVLKTIVSDGRVRVMSIDPSRFFPTFRSDDPTTLREVAVLSSISPDEARERYGLTLGRPAELLETWTADSLRVEVGTATVFSGVNPYGFIPYVHVANLAPAGGGVRALGAGGRDPPEPGVRGTTLGPGGLDSLPRGPAGGVQGRPRSHRSGGGAGDGVGRARIFREGAHGMYKRPPATGRERRSPAWGECCVPLGSATPWGVAQLVVADVLNAPIEGPGLGAAQGGVTAALGEDRWDFDPMDGVVVNRWVEAVDGEFVINRETYPLLQVIRWWFQEELRARRPVRQCQWCKHYFFVYDGRQRYCRRPAGEPGERENSPCATAARGKRFRGKTITALAPTITIGPAQESSE